MQIRILFCIRHKEEYFLPEFLFLLTIEFFSFIHSYLVSLGLIHKPKVLVHFSVLPSFRPSVLPSFRPVFISLVLFLLLTRTSDLIDIVDFSALAVIPRARKSSNSFLESALW